MDLQTADLLRSGLGQPGQHGTSGIGLDDLFRHPETVCRGNGIYPYHLVAGQTQLGQTTGMGLLRRGDQVDAATRLDQGGKCRPQQAPLTQRSLGHQQLGQAVGGPATPRQLSIQDRETRRHGPRNRPTHLRAAPDDLGHMAGEGAWVEGGWGRSGRGWHKEAEGCESGNEGLTKYCTK